MLVDIQLADEMQLAPRPARLWGYWWQESTTQAVSGPEGYEKVPWNYHHKRSALAYSLGQAKHIKPQVYES